MNTSFKNLSLNTAILRALEEQGYTEPTPIQSAAIPAILDGQDVLATAQTGTGKTAAFALPMLQTLTESSNGKSGRQRALILTPTRELALQIDESFRDYGRHLKHRTAVILGGVSPVGQIRNLKQNPDTIVATPGRLLDLKNQGYVDLSGIEILVLDESDRMLDMGFINDVRKIVGATPKKRQTLLFSATISRDVQRLASDMLHDPVTVQVAPPATTSENVDQRVLFVEQANKRALLEMLLSGDGVNRALVFTRTKHRANTLARQLSKSGISADAIHSNKSQGARQKALAAFDRGRVRVLIGTDIVARGIDVENISHVINYEMPDSPESYVHRIGRTARAGTKGIAMSLCSMAELASLSGIEKLTKSRLRVEEHPFSSEAVASLNERRVEKQQPRRRGNGNGYGRKNKPAGSRRRGR